MEEVIIIITIMIIIVRNLSFLRLFPHTGSSHRSKVSQISEPVAIQCIYSGLPEGNKAQDIGIEKLIMNSKTVSFPPRNRCPTVQWFSTLPGPFLSTQVLK